MNHQLGVPATPFASGLSVSKTGPTQATPRALMLGLDQYEQLLGELSDALNLLTEKTAGLYDGAMPGEDGGGAPTPMLGGSPVARRLSTLNCAFTAQVRALHRLTEALEV